MDGQNIRVATDQGFKGSTVGHVLASNRSLSLKSPGLLLTGPLLKVPILSKKTWTLKKKIKKSNSIKQSEKKKL